MRKNYLIHDNGGRPFRVEVNPSENMVNVFINYKFDEYEKKFNKKVFSSKYQKIWIGKSPETEMTLFSGGHGSKFDGNTILLEKSNNSCVFIGDNIFSFKTKGPITEYVSPVGNNDVPYPYAIDQTGTVYLMIENITITPTSATSKTMSKKIYIENPYLFYYMLDRYLNGVKLYKKQENQFDSILKLANINKSMKKEELVKTLGISSIPTYKELVKRL